VSLSDVQYKKIIFTRSDGVNVTLKVSLLNPSDLSENFLVLNVSGIKTSTDSLLFSWIKLSRYTFNEFNFFALNNNLCVKVTDNLDVELASYGTCSLTNRVFGFSFGEIFN